MDKTKRIEWIDVLRFLGIFSIFLSHLEEPAGYFLPFGYRYQTPLFFFIAGAMQNLASTDTNFVEHFRKKFKGIMLPYFFFGLVSIIIIFFQGNANAGLLVKTVVQYLLGIRNQLFAPILWFLPCIFVMSILFYLLKKSVKNRWLILLIGIGLFVVSETLLPHRPILKPSWFWNIDSVLYYFVYYTLGYAVFPYVQKLLSSRFVWAHVGFIISAVLATFYALALLAGKNLTAMLFSNVPNSGPTVRMIGTIILIWFSIFLAQIFVSIPLLQKIGRNTLFLCGSEQVIRHLTPPLFTILGWNNLFASPLGAIIFTFAAMLAANFVIVPVLKTLYNALIELLYPTWLKEKITG